MARPSIRATHVLWLAGIVVAISPAAAAPQFKVLYTFCSQPNCSDGNVPAEDVLLRDSAGNLYGTTRASSTGPKGGTVFEMVRNGARFRHRVLYTFCSKTNCADGFDPEAGLIMDVNGNLYGTTKFGGTHQTESTGGTAFELLAPAPGGKKWKHKTLYNFCALAGCADGSEPAVSLTYQGIEKGQPYDGSSPLFGNTQFGPTTQHSNGTSQDVVFRLTFNTTGKGHVTALHVFCSDTFCTDGTMPNGPLTIDDAGNLYGATASGGANDEGALYKVAPAGYSVLYDFCPPGNACIDGIGPYSPILDSNGNLVGTAFNGGPLPNGSGVIYTVSPATGVESTLYLFCQTDQENCPDGAHPVGRLLQDPSGNLFGAANAGGAEGAGVIFELSSGSETVLKNFCSDIVCPDGNSPNGGFVEDSSGTIFGLTLRGGLEAGGVLWQLKP